MVRLVATLLIIRGSLCFPPVAPDSVLFLTLWHYVTVYYTLVNKRIPYNGKWNGGMHVLYEGCVLIRHITMPINIWVRGARLVSNPDPSLFRSAGCIASPAHERKGLATFVRFSCAFGMQLKL